MNHKHFVNIKTEQIILWLLKQFPFMTQSINLPPSAHTITSSAHCSIMQPSAAYSQISSAHTTAAIKSSVHTAAMYSHEQLSAANLQCTLRPTAAMYNHLHYSYTIQCILQLHYLMPIPYSASSEEG